MRESVWVRVCERDNRTRKIDRYIERKREIDKQRNKGGEIGAETKRERKECTPVNTYEYVCV